MMPNAIANGDYPLSFFSTCAQTFASLVSVFGMFIVFRLQVEEGRVGHLRDRMLHYHENHQKLPFESILRELKRMEGEHRLREELEHSENIRSLLRDYGGAVAKRAWLSHYSRRPIFLLVTLVFSSLLFLALYPLYKTSLQTILILQSGTLLVGAIPLFEIARIVLVSIRSD